MIQFNSAFLKNPLNFVQVKFIQDQVQIPKSMPIRKPTHKTRPPSFILNPYHTERSRWSPAMPPILGNEFVIFSTNDYRNQASYNLKSRRPRHFNPY